MASDGAKLHAVGATVLLADGRPRQLIFDMEALLLIENQAGSLQDYTLGLQQGFRGKVLRSVLAGLTGGLAHYRAKDKGRDGLTTLEISRLLVFDDIQKYIDALDAAWEEGLPSAGKTPGKDSGAASSSRGRRSTAGSRLTTHAASASSGA